MKIVIATAAALLAVSSFAFAADNNGGDNNGGNDGKSSNSNQTKDSTGDLDDQKACKDGTGGGAPCQEKGTEVQQ